MKAKQKRPRTVTKWVRHNQSEKAVKAILGGLEASTKSWQEVGEAGIEYLNKLQKQSNEK